MRCLHAVLGLILLTQCNRPPSPATVVVYAYDSFIGDGSLGRWMAESFKKTSGCETHYVPFSTAGEALNQVTLEGADTRADVVVGIDQTLLSRARQVGGFLTQPASLLEGVDRSLVFDSQRQWIPFDYGYVAFVYDDRRTRFSPGLTFESFLQDPRLKRRLVLEDPRTGTLGRSLLVWTQMVFPDRVEKVWRTLIQQALSIAPGWSAAYGLFLGKEADLVLSYTTSPAYHQENEKHSHIRAVLFKEGQYTQIETAAQLEKSKSNACATAWLKYLLSPETQKQLPLLQWMYPVKNTELPASFKNLPVVKKALTPTDKQADLSRSTLNRWTQLAAGLK